MDKINGLKLLRAEFPANQISKLPKGSKAQNECQNDQKKNCQICGGWHHPAIIHLDYVGHAALTDRLLDVDPEWYWEPVAFGVDGLPAFDKIGGLWIRLTVLGVSRLGYGHPDGKAGGNAIKEAIGDALRNAAMRFGAALDLWHKGDLHAHVADEVTPDNQESVIEYANTTEITSIKQALLLRGIDEPRALTQWKLASFEVIPKDWVAGILHDLRPKQKTGVTANETV
jgi:hypothetical protein